MMQIINTIICDEVRQENNGKLILIGVYAADILLNSPGQIRLTLWLQFSTAQPSGLPIRVQVKAGRKVLFLTKELQFPPDQAAVEHIVISISPIMLDIKEECKLTFQIKFGDQKWKTIKNIAVKIKSP